MAPAAVFALPFFNLYSAINLFDTPWAVALAHCIFNVPLAVWILEGFMAGNPRCSLASFVIGQMARAGRKTPVWRAFLRPISSSRWRISEAALE